MRAKLEVVSAKIILLATSVKWPNITNTKQDILFRLGNLLSTLVQTDCLTLASQTSILYLLILEDIGQIDEGIERLLGCQYLPPSLRVSVLLGVASLAVRNQLYERSEKYILRAEMLLDNPDHVLDAPTLPPTVSSESKGR